MKPTKAWQLLHSPEKWCKGQLAMDMHGNKVEPFSDTAERFCAVGAIRRAYGYDSHSDIVKEKLRDAVGRLIPGWNDAPERTWEEVYGKLKALDI